MAKHRKVFRVFPHWRERMDFDPDLQCDGSVANSFLHSSLNPIRFVRVSGLPCFSAR